MRYDSVFPTAQKTASTPTLHRWVFAGAAALVCAGLIHVTLGSGQRPSAELDSAATWLVSTAPAVVGLTNALVPSPANATTESITLNAAIWASGAPKTVRRNSHVIVTGERSQLATVLDTKLLKPIQIATSTASGIDIIGSSVVLVDAEAGTISANDGRVARLGTAIGSFEASGDALWSTLPADGSLVRVDETMALPSPVSAFAAGHRPLMAAIDGGVALFDPPTGEITLARGTSIRLDRHSTKPAAGTEVSFTAAADGSLVTVLTAADNGTLLSLVDISGGTGTTSMSLSGGGGRPVILGDRAYVADRRAGTVITVQLRPRLAVLATAPVTSGPADLELFAERGMVWANDPNSPRATVIHGDTHWPVVKYGGHKTISPTRTLLTTPPTASTTSATTAVTPTRILTKTPTKGPTQTSGPPPPSPVSAHIRSLSDGDEVGRCEIVSGDVDVPAGKTLFLAQRRTRPTDSTYYFVYAGPPTGVTGKSWSVRRYFGTAPPQEYSVLLLIVDVDVAAQFWESHRIPNQGYAAATRLPVEPADTVNVRQTSLEDPC